MCIRPVKLEMKIDIAANFEGWYQNFSPTWFYSRDSIMIKVGDDFKDGTMLERERENYERMKK